MEDDWLLSVSCAEGDRQEVDRLLANGAKPTEYCLHRLISHSMFEHVVRLIKNGVPFDGSLGAIRRITPDTGSMVEYLMALGAKLDTLKIRTLEMARFFDTLDPKRDYLGPRLAGMIFAARSGHLGLVRALKVTPVNEALDWAAKNGHLMIVRELLLLQQVDTTRALKLAKRHNRKDVVAFLEPV